MDFEFSWTRLFLIIVCTVFPFCWLRKKILKEQLFIGTFLAFTFFYSGFGYAWEDCSSNYIFLYLPYMVVLSIAIYYAQKGANRTTTSDKKRASAIKCFIKKYGDSFILLYILLCIISLISEGKFMNLIYIPEIDMESAVAATFENNTNGLLYYLKSIIYVFYIVSLFKYKDNLKRFILYLLIPVYVEYADTCYLGRGEMMVNFIIILTVLCLKYPQYRKRMILGVFIVMPVFAWVLTWYTFYRKGLVFSMSLSDSILLLLHSETSYPEHFNVINQWVTSKTLISPYLEWLLTLSLPGFLKDSTTDFSFNFIFSEKLLGLNRGVDGFNVLLPGVVNESLFIFGWILFPLHAIIYGIIIGKLYKFLKYNDEILLLIFCCVNGAYAISRAGTQANYPFYFKHLLIYFIVMYFYTKKQSVKL